MNDPRIAYTPLPDATPEGELEALAAVYAFVLDCHDRKKATDGSGGQDDGKEIEDDPADKASVLRRPAG